MATVSVGSAAANGLRTAATRRVPTSRNTTSVASRCVVTLTLATALLCGPALAPPAAAQDGRRAASASRIPGRAIPHPATYRICGRAAVRDCQANARMDMQACEAFPGRLACADRVLDELSACWAATGCF